MEQTELKQQIKTKMIQYLNLTTMTPDDINDDMPLFGDDGLALDSIDALELIVMLQREFGVTIRDPKDGRKTLTDVNAMAEFVSQNTAN